MKILKYKYLFLALLAISISACSDDDDSGSDGQEILPPLTAGEADFSNYVAVGASFSGGFTDNALFIAAQQNSFPNILAQQFSQIGGGNFVQPLMSDNNGGFLFGGMPLFSPEGDRLFGPRLFFDGEGPVTIPFESTTEGTTVLSGPFNNYGIPGAKSFHLGFPGYGLLNPYFGRMASSPTATVLADAASQNPTFFTISEIGGNDVLGYALAGGDAVDQTGNLDPSTYGPADITDPNVFAASFSASVDALTANGAKGVVGNIPYITSLSHFTAVPHNPLDPTDPAFAAQIPTLNTLFGALNQVYAFLGTPERVIIFSEDEASAVVIHDESLVDLSAQITGVLNANPDFPAFLAQFGLPPQAAPVVAGLLGQTYGQTRQATENDLFVLPSSSVIGTVNLDYAAFLGSQGLPPALAGQFAVEGITLPLEDKWCLLPSEQDAIRMATDAYNDTITAIAAANNLALVDFKGILIEASTTGYADGGFILTTDLVLGGMVSLDGVHLTARGYAAMANAILRAIDAQYGSNFEASGNLVNTGDYPTNYPPNL